MIDNAMFGCQSALEFYRTSVVEYPFGGGGSIMDGSCMRNAAAALALSGVTLLIGCSRPPSSKPDANVPQDGDAPPRYVVAADIVGRRLERRKDQPVWEFTADRFILTNH